MHNDCRGLPITAASADTVTAFDHAIDAYLSYRSDIMTYIMLRSVLFLRSDEWLMLPTSLPSHGGF